MSFQKGPSELLRSFLGAQMEFGEDQSSFAKASKNLEKYLKPTEHDFLEKL